MPPSAVATAGAGQGVVAETVKHSVATRTLQVLVAKRYPEPALKHDSEEGRLVVKPSGPSGRRV